jgi:polyphosphate kinase
MTSIRPKSAQVLVPETKEERMGRMVNESKYISRDLSWVQFNYRVLDQAKKIHRTILERLKFLAIASSNLDEFFMIRVGSLYNYIDYGKQRVDYSSLREQPFKKRLFTELKTFVRNQNDYYKRKIMPLFDQHGFRIAAPSELTEQELQRTSQYFSRTIFPMLTPMVYDSYHTFPLLMNKRLQFVVVTRDPNAKKDKRKLSFIQIPKNLPRFFEVHREDKLLFIPIEEIIRAHIHRLFKNVPIESCTLFRITRNGDFTLEESDDIEANFLEELTRKLKTRRTGRVVRVQIEEGYDEWMIQVLKKRWDLDEDNIFTIRKGSLIDFTCFWEIIGNKEFKHLLPAIPSTVPPMNYPERSNESIFEILKERDILLHHPYNSMEPVLELVDRAADDPDVLAIKITLYRVAKDSRITSSLLRAAENGKHVSVLFEVKARFDEENNLQEAERLQKAGCFVIYGVSSLKTHTKLLMIVRKEEDSVTSYVHLSSGNYNESTSRLYTDIGLLTTHEVVAQDVLEFFNAITGHSQPDKYQFLITAPHNMRPQLVEMIRREAANARKGLPSGIVIKINSLEDKETIDEMYKASQAGVPIKLIVRGICCLRPVRKGLSENIKVFSIVGDFLEHSRIYYFHNNGAPNVYVGSADVMVRSFERRLESLFRIESEVLKQQVINILHYNLKDNVNCYVMRENGTYYPKRTRSEVPFSVHREFFHINKEKVLSVRLF